MVKNLTIEQARMAFGTQKFCFSIFKTRDASGNVVNVFSHNADGTVATYADPSTGEIKSLPKLAVKDSAGNIVAFCSASVAKKKLEGGKALEGSYFKAFEGPNGVSYTLQAVASTSSDLEAE